MTTIKNFRIKNITCAACVKLSRSALEKIAGVTQAIVSLETGEVELSAERAVEWNEITDALRVVGKEAVNL